MPKKTLGTTVLTLEEYIFICSCIYDFLLFFTVNNNHIHKCFFKEFVFAFTIPCTFSEIMKDLLLVEHLLAAGF